jgi:hypothetical protein
MCVPCGAHVRMRDVCTLFNSALALARALAQIAHALVVSVIFASSAHKQGTLHRAGGVLLAALGGSLIVGLLIGQARACARGTLALRARLS